MNKNKGFTLIELLAVIVILAILMVISVPKILNVIENSKKSAAESSIKLLKDAIRSQVTSGDMTETNLVSDESGCYTFNFDDQTSGNAKELQLKNKDKIKGTIKYCNGNFVNNTLVFNGQDMSNTICKKAEEKTLHTEECKQTYNILFCSETGLTGQTITYGTVPGKELKSGDAFDCDVNGDGVYDSKTERFYYVSDYYNTRTKKFETDTAVLIYYNNVSNGKPSNSTTSAYDLSGKNNNGPVTAIEQLPSTSEWKNVSLKNTSRSISAISSNGEETNKTEGGVLPSDFSYKGKAARIPTLKEVQKACNTTIDSEEKLGILNKYNYLFENTKYSDDSNATWAFWLETPYATGNNNAFHVNGDGKNITSNNAVSDILLHGVRPVIEVPKSNIEY